MPRSRGVSAIATDLLDPRDDRPAARAALDAWLRLQHTLALRPELAARLLRRSGDPVAALRASGAPLPRRAHLESDRATLRALGARGLPLSAAAYPVRLAALRDPAPLLWVRGEVDALSARSLAIVGSRAATAYGRRVAGELAAELAAAGLVIVSGLARGIDAAAHRGALEAGGRSVAVLAGGLDWVYPPEHRGLADELAVRGAVVSEFPPATEPRRPFFPLRNRLISGLAEALVVVEARPRSGSLITAAHAADQGREVFAVPGPITAPTSAGPNGLLRDGAIPVTAIGDVAEVLGLGELARPEPLELPAAPGLRRILDALLEAPATRDELGRRLGRPPERLALELLELELLGRLAEDRDGRLRVVTPG